MCAKAPSPPAPVAPPAPIPMRDNRMEGVRARQSAAFRSSKSGYQATQITGAGGDPSAAPVASSVLGA